MKKILITLFTLLMCVNLSAQVVIKSNASPTLTDKGMFGISEKIAETILPALKEYKVSKADTNLFYIPSDPRIVDISLLSQATSEIIGNNIIYRQKIVGLDATSVKVSFDRLKLSKNAQMYIYTPSGSVVTGPVTSAENIGEDRIWGSNNFRGSSAIIEILIPSNEKFENDIHISKITLGIDLNKFSNPSDPASFGWYGNADQCCYEFNVLCSYGNDWVNERKAVCLIEFEESGNTYYGSGALVANTCNSNKPYLLTAHHNTAGHYTNNWQFYFGWWSSTCYGDYTQTALLFNGANLKATWDQSDFSLLELINTPSASSDITYLGWSRSSTAATSSVGIHHPGGDQMKISFSNTPATIDNRNGYTGNVWKVDWYGFGATQGGSSGSPMFNQDKKVVGQLWAGTNHPVCSSRYSQYGRFDLSWTGGGTYTTGLSHWLDPTGTNDMTTNTTSVANLINIDPSNYNIVGPSQFCTSQNYSMSGLPSGATVSWGASYPFVSSSQSNNILTLNRIDDGDAIIYATISVCGQTFYKQKNVRVGGAPITVTATQLACDYFKFEVSGEASGYLYHWSSANNTILYSGTSTTETTPYPTIYANSMGDDAAIVNTTNTCFQSVYRNAQLWNIYLRNIDGLLGIYSNGDQVVCSATTTPYDTYYKWYINGYLDSEGESLSTFATYNYPQGQGIMCGDNTIRVEVFACGGMVSSDAYHFWKMGNCFGRNNSSSNVELYPNPAFNQTTIRLTDIKESPVKLTSIKSIRISDKMGNFITEVKYTKNSKSVNVDLSRLSIGIYYVEVSDGINKTMLPLNVLK